ncbi:type I 3-dehydroquinate dehydratase [Martelella alba]|uniref:3-dehydroquinate dehydratase n=1 Tax=Martelella alba TaxID=2590451 RepID=A0ABY2SGZ3_9HYPH|nr:type I 3-dehydroquinate dehydratase [Martelella alba]TKI02926.1 type I 3-dehydroquinate dehydratase [Martelella alba]
MQTVTVRDLTIGSGAPKIIVPLMGKDAASIRAEAQSYQDVDFDILEWRADHFADAGTPERVIAAARELRRLIADKPILFTFRTSREGGEQALAPADYLALNRAIVDSGLADLIDLELFSGDQAVAATVEYAHAKGVKVVMSNHEFHKTPPQEEIVGRLRKMQSLGADIPKIAVMPQNKTDVLTLLAATLEMHERYAERPIITMSMSRSGIISRLAGEVFGSAATFGAVKKASAPGQIAIGELRSVLEILHKS